MGLSRNDSTGNLIIEFIIDFPEKLSKDTIKILNSIL